MQTAAIDFAEVRKFRFEAPIVASDGEAGRLVAVVVDAERRAVTHIGIRLGVFARQLHFVPLNLVPEARAEAVSLSITLDDIHQKSVPTPSGVKLTSSTNITAGGKTLGRLTQLTITSGTQALRHLVVDRGLRREALVPASVITAVSERQISVDLGALSPDGLTPFRPDADLYQAVHAAIYDYQPLRVDLPGIEIHALDGTVWLRGHVSSDLNCRLVEDQVQGIPGLSEIYNELIADSELAAAISLALAHDPRTAGEHIGVYPRLGEVRLRGGVRTPASRQAAGEIATAVPGIRDVVNELHIDPQARVVPVMAGVTNQMDIVPGGS